MTINSRKVQGLLDSGANCTILGKGALDFLKSVNLKKYHFQTNLQTADGTNHQADVYVNLPITFNNKTRTIPTLVDFWNVFNIQPVCGQIDAEPLPSDNIDLTIQESRALAEVISELKTSVPNSPISRTHLIEHRIETGDTKPIK